MHYIYLDEAGCTLRAFNDPDQPIFILGGLAVGDKKWNGTLTKYEEIIQDYFNGNLPENFELHSYELLSPHGDGPFENHNRDARNKLALDLLNILKEKSLYSLLLSIDKAKIQNVDIERIRNREHIELRTPYLLSFDNAITLVDSFISSRSRTARGMFIIDEKDSLKSEIESITKHRRFHPTKAKRTKRIVEFTNPIDSHKNPMIQLADLICFVSKKFLGIENDYHNNYPNAAKKFFKEAYSIVDERLYRKTFVNETGRYQNAFNDFMNEVHSPPKQGWRNRYN